MDAGPVIPIVGVSLINDWAVCWLFLPFSGLTWARSDWSSNNYRSDLGTAQHSGSPTQTNQFSDAMPGMPGNLKQALFFHLFPDPFSSPLNSQLGTCQDRREEIKIKYTTLREWTTVRRLIKHYREERRFIEF